jgi:NADH-quinone oxidoreductase subunit G
MVVHTESAKVVAARKAVLEFILVNHPVDCPICDQAGECKLQDYYMAYDAAPSRVRTPKVGKAKVHPIGPHVVYDGERCILCTRCVRFCDQITGTSELTVVERGDHSEIRTFPGKELDNAYSMNVTDICPVGALTTRDFRFKCRVWLLSSTDSICVGCSKGCNVHLEHFQGEVQRYRPRFNPEVNEYWMCDTGRLSYKRLHSDRATTLRIDGATGMEWPRASRSVAALLKGVDSSKMAFVVSAQASTESLVAAKAFQEQCLPGATVYWSGLPDGDSDDLLVRSDKNPNRAGVFAIFGAVPSITDLADRLKAGGVSGVYMMGTATPFDEAGERSFAELASGTGLFVLQSSHGGPLHAAARVALPSATHAEQDGTYINEDGIAQPAFGAFAPADQALPDWAVFIRLSRASGVKPAFDGFESLQSHIFDRDAAAE